MNPSRSAARLLVAASAVLVLAGIGVASSPAPAAHAQSGYRLCGVYNSSQNTYHQGDSVVNIPVDGKQGIGTGLVVKVWKGGGGTCDSKLGFMKTYYDIAYPGSSVQFSFRMVRCEDFGSAITGTGFDPCGNFETNRIYRYTSKYDLIHPDPHPSFHWWHD